MTSLPSLSKYYELKKIDRMNSNGNRKESSAEHSWSCLILADHLLTITSQKLDRLKIFDLLLYHDVVEIEAGDHPIHPKYGIQKPKEKEEIAAKKLKEQLPNPLNKKFYELFNEYEAQETLEAKFAKAVDKLDPMIQGLQKKKWKHWTRDFLEKKFGESMKPFPKIEKEFNEFLDYIEKNNYLDK